MKALKDSYAGKEIWQTSSDGKRTCEELSHEEFHPIKDIYPIYTMTDIRKNYKLLGKY